MRNVFSPLSRERKEQKRKKQKIFNKAAYNYNPDRDRDRSLQVEGYSARANYPVDRRFPRNWPQ